MSMSAQPNPEYRDLPESTLLKLKETFINSRQQFIGVHSRTVANCDRGIAAIDAELGARRLARAQCLLESMNDRFQEYNEGGQVDRSLMLSGEATSQANELWRLASTPDGNLPMPARQALAWFHWARYMARPVGEDLNDLQAAMVLFAPVFLAASHEVPDEVRDFLESTSPAAVVDNERNRGDKPASYVGRTYPRALDYALAVSHT